MLLHMWWICLRGDVCRAGIGAKFLGTIISRGLGALLAVGICGWLRLLVGWETVARIGGLLSRL